MHFLEYSLAKITRGRQEELMAKEQETLTHREELQSRIIFDA